MADVAITPQYRLILRSWQDGRVTIREVELFVRTGWLTREQADEIYKLPRKQTDLVLDDPLTDDTIETTRLEVNR